MLCGKLHCKKVLRLNFFSYKIWGGCGMQDARPDVPGYLPLDWTSLEQLLSTNVKRIRGGLVFKAHRLLYHSSLGSRVTKKKRKKGRVRLSEPWTGSRVGSQGVRVREIQIRER